MKNRKRLVRQLGMLLLLNLLLVGVFQAMPEARAVVYRQGSTGDMVRQIQTRLKNWGYYTGNVDGIYGSKTVAGVKYFQRKNGLAVDGICGTKTLAALGIRAPASSSSGVTNRTNDLSLLARIISAESRGEPYSGQVAVGAVVLNRVKHPSFPKTLAGVIYQDGAFTAIVDGQVNEPVTESAKKAAQDAMNGWDPSYGCIYYYNPKTATNQWIRTRPVVTTIGSHVFCK